LAQQLHYILSYTFWQVFFSIFLIFIFLILCP